MNDEDKLVAVVAIIPKTELNNMPAGFDRYYVTLPKKSDAPISTDDDVVTIISEKLRKLLKGTKR